MKTTVHRLVAVLLTIILLLTSAMAGSAEESEESTTQTTTTFEQENVPAEEDNTTPSDTETTDADNTASDNTDADDTDPENPDPENPDQEPEEPVCEHEYEIEPAVAATAYATGLTEGKKCTKCGEVVSYQMQTPALGFTKPNATDAVMQSADLLRSYGQTRFDTSLLVADKLKTTLGVSKFETIIVANGTNFADALSGSYLAACKSAPIISITDASFCRDTILNYIRNSLAENGTIYILGGEVSVSASLESSLKTITSNTIRLSGEGRYDTNLAILKAAGLPQNSDLIIASGSNFADAMSASASGKPVLLVNSDTGVLTEEQQAYLAWLNEAGLTPKTVTVLGGTIAVPDSLKEAVETTLGVGATRLSGATRCETSTAVASKFCGSSSNMAILVWAGNFPDGLCAGPLAYALGCPILLVTETYTGPANSYVNSKNCRVLSLGGVGTKEVHQVTDAAIGGVKSGKIRNELYGTGILNGFYEQGGDCIKFTDGYKDSSYTNVLANGAYVENGIVSTKSGFQEVNGTCYYMTDGVVWTNFSGAMTVNRGTYTLKNGAVTGVKFSVTGVNQKPTYPTGCEGASATTLLNWYGINVSLTNMINAIPRENLHTENGKTVGPSIYEKFVGDPKSTYTSSNPGYGAFAPVVTKSMNQVLSNYGSSLKAYDLTGTTLEGLFQELRAGHPVIVWSTYNMKTPTTVNAWYIKNGSTYTYFSYPRGTHVTVLTGYDANNIYMMDVYGATSKTFSRSAFNAKYQLLFQQAIVVK